MAPRIWPHAPANRWSAAWSFRRRSPPGGYLWWYSEDLQERWGETQATASQIWVQPPGTPAVGEAFLRAYRATGDQRYLEAARAAARALAWGQLETGGWDYRIDFDEEQSRRWYFRRDQGKLTPEEAARRRNTSTFDDDNSQSALRFLMGVCRETKDAEIQEALDYGLAFLLKAQYPNGAWPQRYPPPKSGYGSYYTFNDDTIRDCVRTALPRTGTPAGRVPGRGEASRNFILKAQQPEPQPVWAQQDDHDMKPAWARKFEPSVCSSESVGVMRTLIDLYIETGEERFLGRFRARSRGSNARRSRRTAGRASMSSGRTGLSLHEEKRLVTPTMTFRRTTPSRESSACAGSSPHMKR